MLSVIFLIGAMGGFMIHTFLCLQPTIYEKIIEKVGQDLAVDVIQSAFRQMSGIEAI